MSVFVFGSNLEGIHGGGAARFACENHGAIWGEGIGHHGNSYAIPTMMSLDRIKPHIDVFIDYAMSHPHLQFDLTRIGTGIAGYDWDRDIRPMFPRQIPENVKLLEPLK